MPSFSQTAAAVALFCAWANTWSSSPLFGARGQERQPYVAQITLPEKPVRLKPLNVYPNKISLSGYSSGGGFAQQLQFAYSSMFSGIGVFSQTFYRCGPADGVQAGFDNYCTTLGDLPPEAKWSPRQVLSEIADYHRKGWIEDPRNLRNTKLYLFAGTQNWLYSLEQQLHVLDIYRPFIGNHRRIRTHVWNANHTLPSNTFGSSCLDSDANGYYVGYCGLSGAYEALSFIHGKYAVPFYPTPHKNIRLQPLLTFDQTEFFYGIDGKEHLMDQLGYLYIPTKCHKYKCMLHLYFHGCRSGKEFLGPNHIRYSGFLQVAELNNIIMLFPQAVTNAENQIGCWDTYGLTGPNFATKRGAQIVVVRNMIDRILGKDIVLKGIYARPPTLPYLKLPTPSIMSPLRRYELIFPAGVKFG